MLARIVALLVGFSVCAGSALAAGDVAGGEPVAAAAEREPVIAGYYEQWGIYSPNTHIDDLPLDRLTQLIYQRASVTAGAEVVPGDSFADLQHVYSDDELEKLPYTGSFGKLYQAKRKYPQLKTIISIGGFQVESLPRVAANPALRRAFAESALRFVQKYPFDGIEINWDYSLNFAELKGKNTTSSPQDFIRLMEEIRQVFDHHAATKGERYSVSVAVHPDMILQDVDALVRALKFVGFANLYGAYLHLPGNRVTEHISPLYYPGSPSRLGSVDQWVRVLTERGVAPEKIIVGVSPSIFSWQGLAPGESEGHGLHRLASSASSGTWDTEYTGNTGIYSRAHLMKLQEEGSYLPYWDDVQKMPWLFSNSKLGGNFVSFENPQSIGEKLKYISRHSLGGVGVITLHSDTRDSTSLVHTIYRARHPLRSMWLDAVAFFEQRWLFILGGASLLSVLAVAVALVRRRQALDVREEAKDKGQYTHLKRHTQVLEWHLSQLYSLLNGKQHGKKSLKLASFTDLSHNTADLLGNLTYLLSQTTLGNGGRPLQEKSLSVTSLFTYLDWIWPGAEGPPVLDNRVDSGVGITADPIYLSQLIVSLGDILPVVRICVSESSTENDQLLLTIQFDSVVHAQPRSYTKVKEVFRKAAQMGLKIAQVGASDSSLVIQLPRIIVRERGDWLPEWRVASPAATARAVEAITESASNSMASDEGDGGRDDSLSTVLSNNSDRSRLMMLQAFSQSATEIQDIGQLLHKACEQFDIATDTALSISVYQGENLLAEIGDLAGGGTERYTYRAVEFRCVISCDQDLTEDDLNYFRALVSHIQLVRKTLQQMVSKPILLSELHRLSSDKGRISHIKGDKGYIAVYLFGEEEPYYLSLRIRAVKQYFDDDSLLQVHRSFLVNPDKVVCVHKLAKRKHEVELQVSSAKSCAIPISRNYYLSVKEFAENQNRCWFDREEKARTQKSE